MVVKREVSLCTSTGNQLPSSGSKVGIIISDERRRENSQVKNVVTDFSKLNMNTTETGNTEQLGPEKRHVPVREFYSCSGCKFYSHRLVKSGMDPIYRNDCEHPRIKYDKDISYHGSLSMEGNLGKAEQTPNWCPFLQPERENENQERV